MNRTKHVETIDHIRKRFKGKSQWLLIRVTKYDKKTTTPLAGVLLAHDVNRDVIYEKSITPKGLILVDHSEDGLPEGYAFAL